MSTYARIRIAWPKGAASATLDDTPTARALVAALPVKAKAQNVLGRIDGDPQQLASVRSGDSIAATME